MGPYYSRRQWLKTSALAAAGLAASANLRAFPREAASPALSPLEENVILLNSNENPYGISEKARSALVRAANESHRYPQGSYSRLKELISSQERISPEHIILGAGSTEIMTILIAAYGARRGVLASDPTYFDFVDYAERAGCILRLVRLNEKLEHDLTSMAGRIGPDIGLIYICNPLNPTGTITPKEGLFDFCGEASRKALVAVDEAYHDYVEDGAYSSMLDLVRQGGNVVVMRTFSKIHGLAGLRVGYGMAHPDIIKKLEAFQMNFAPVSYPGLRAAMASYQDSGFRISGIEKNRSVRSSLYRQLEKLGYEPIPTHANFVLFKVGRDAREVAAEFSARRIMVRPFSFWGSHWIRVTLGTPEEMRIFSSALAQIS